MTDQPSRHGGRSAIPFLVIGAFIGASAQNHRYRPKRAVNPAHNLDARQAMAVARIANIISIVAVTVFVAYCVYALRSL